MPNIFKTIKEHSDKSIQYNYHLAKLPPIHFFYTPKITADLSGQERHLFFWEQQNPDSHVISTREEFKRRSFRDPFLSCSDFKQTLLSPIAMPFICFILAGHYLLSMIGFLALTILYAVTLDFKSSQELLSRTAIKALSVIYVTIKGVSECLQAIATFLCRAISTINLHVKTRCNNSPLSVTTEGSSSSANASTFQP